MDDARPANPGLRELVGELATLYRWMAPERRRNLRQLVVLLLLRAIAELVTIGSVLPFLALLLGEGADVLPARLQGLAGWAGDDLALFVGAGVITAAVLAAALRLLLIYAVQRWVHDMGFDLSVAVYARRLNQPYEDFVRGNSADILAALDQTHALVTAVLGTLLNAAIAAVTAVLIVGLLFALGSLVAASVFGLVGAFYGAIMLATRRRLSRDAAAFSPLYRARAQSVQEGMGAIRDVMIDRSQHVFVADFAAHERAFRDIHVRSSFLTAAPRRVVEAAGIVLIVGIALILSARPGGRSRRSRCSPRWRWGSSGFCRWSSKSIRRAARC